MEYEKQAEEFLKATKTEFKAVFLRHDKYFDDDTEKRDIYLITLKRGNREYSFEFGQSIADSGFKLINTNTHEAMRYSWLNEITYNTDHDKDKLRKFIMSKFGSMNGITLKYEKVPTAYDVLACLQKYDVGLFEDFCGDFGYDTDSIKAKKAYDAVRNEYLNLSRLFNDEELDLMGEIQ